MTYSLDQQKKKLFKS